MLPTRLALFPLLVLVIGTHHVPTAHAEQDPLGTAAAADRAASAALRKGKYAEAEVLYRNALTIREQGLGRDHPETARTLDNVGAMLGHQKRYADAELR
jgi:hypothetical protein